MRRNPFAALSAATAVAALSLSGCSGHDEPNRVLGSGTGSTTFLSAPPIDAPPLPTADELTSVLYRLADPAVKGTDKLYLLEGGTAEDAATIDNFAAALRDGGFAPLTCTASEIRRSDRQAGDAIATININTANPATAGGFTFPMEFHPSQGGWQLSRETADMIMAFGNARTGGGPAPGPTPPPGPPPAGHPPAGPPPAGPPVPAPPPAPAPPTP